MIYRSAESGDIPRLCGLWLSCFDEKPEAAKCFFERNLSDTHGYLAEENGEIIAAVYLIDCRLRGQRAHYLCGAATKPSHRGRGVMSRLIGFALDDAVRRGDRFSTLLPADEGLYRFYAQLGYTAGCEVRTRAFDCGAESPASAGEPDTQALQRLCCKDRSLFWDQSFIDFAGRYYGCYGVKTLKSAYALAFADCDNGCADVFYALYNDISELKSLLSAEGVRRFSLAGCGENPLFSGAPAKKYGMIKSLTDENPPDGVYIGITLS